MKSRIFFLLLFFLFLLAERQASGFFIKPYNYLFRFVVMYVFILCFCYSYKPGGRKLVLLFFLGFMLPDIIIRLLEDAKYALRSFPDLLSEIVPAFSAYSLYKYKRYWPGIAGGILLLVFILFFNPYWMQYLRFGDFHSSVSIPVTGDWTVYDENGDAIHAVEYKHKVVLLDIWSTSCGACFVRFPQLEALYTKYKDDPRLVVQAVNMPLKRDTAGMAFAMIRKRGFTFPVVIAAADFDSVFHVDAYPLVLILRNDTILFRGAIEQVESALSKILEKDG